MFVGHSAVSSADFKTPVFSCLQLWIMQSVTRLTLTKSDPFPLIFMPKPTGPRMSVLTLMVQSCLHSLSRDVEGNRSHKHYVMFGVTHRVMVGSSVLTVNLFTLMSTIL